MRDRTGGARHQLTRADFEGVGVYHYVDAHGSPLVERGGGVGQPPGGIPIQIPVVETGGLAYVDPAAVAELIELLDATAQQIYTTVYEESPPAWLTEIGFTGQGYGMVSGDLADGFAVMIDRMPFEKEGVTAFSYILTKSPEAIVKWAAAGPTYGRAIIGGPAEMLAAAQALAAPPAPPTLPPGIPPPPGGRPKPDQPTITVPPQPPPGPPQPTPESQLVFESSSSIPGWVVPVAIGVATVGIGAALYTRRRRHDKMGA